MTQAGFAQKFEQAERNPQAVTNWKGRECHKWRRQEPRGCGGASAAQETCGFLVLLLVTWEIPVLGVFEKFTCILFGLLN
jgi:hypothetical protein